jgi:hypothetical protein
MCSCSKSKNQTSKGIFKFLGQPDKQESLGIGLFLIPAPEIGIMEYRLVTVEGISYKETVKRGQMCEVFKFFPLGISLHTDEQKSQFITVNTPDDLKKLYCAHGNYCDGSNCDGICVCVGSYLVCYQY